jgi:hypothetical protein
MDVRSLLGGPRRWADLDEEEQQPSSPKGDLYSGMDLSLGPNGATEWLGMLGNMWGPQTQGGGSQEEQFLRALIDLERQKIARQPTIEEAYMAKRRARDPVGAAISEADAELASHRGIDWFKRANRIDELTPEAKLAMQGPSAMNQWARLGGVEGIDQDEFNRLVDARERASRRSYT